MFSVETDFLPWYISVLIPNSCPFWQYSFFNLKKSKFCKKIIFIRLQLEIRMSNAVNRFSFRDHRWRCSRVLILEFRFAYLYL